MEKNYEKIESLFQSEERVVKLVERAGKREVKETIVLEGLHSSSKSFAIAAATKRGSGIDILLSNSREEALYAAGDLYNLVGSERVFFFPSTKNHSYRRAKKDSSHQVQRTAALSAVREMVEGNSPHNNIILVAYPHSISELIIDQKSFNNSFLKISKGETLSHQFIKELLLEYSFERVDFVTEPGQYAVRGGLIDLFSYSHNHPFRVEFFGDLVERIRTFDIESQRSLEELQSLELFPDLYEMEQSNLESLFDWAEGKATLWITDIEQFSIKLKEIEQLKEESDNGEMESRALLSLKEFKNVVKSHKSFLFSPLSREYDGFEKIVFSTSPQPLFNKNFELLAKELREKREQGYKTLLLSENSSQIERLKAILESIEGEDKLHFETLNFALYEGFIDNRAKIALYTDHQIFQRHRRVKALRRVEKSERVTIEELNSYEIGDYVVHIDHGVGQFGGLVKSSQNGVNQEAVKLIFRDGDVLFVSIHGLHRIARYKSKEGSAPKIDKIGSAAWQRVKNQTKSKVKDIANDLIDLYAKRLEVKGFAYSADSYLQQELESSFIYEETPDQLKANRAIKEDMERPYPMDRLVCGDVGFGKTELAVRAAFKAVADSKQVAILVPTTILALQHYQTFSGRLEQFPCRVDYISRLRGSKEIKEITEELERGTIDIIIGTHRLLNREIKFKDLGLLIIDEEQKFGVAAKERLRELKLNVDTLTLSATPIPRTLQFSLLGARDLSIITTPPPNRLPIQTEVIEFDEEIIKEAINYEVERGGQLFFLHNRVEDIESVAAIIGRIAPEASIAIGHGQMEPKLLERRILEFIRGDYDILVATTIVENGIDIPNANTIFINQAQNFGLSDLHQLRGRVGRSNKRAFCYLIVPSMISISEQSRRRIRAIESFSELGSGFNIAMQDLDIRGAGNLLGGEQSGFIADMGFETYQRILAEAFNEIREERALRGESLPGDKEENFITDSTIDTDLEALIPDSYLSITAEKIKLYKELDLLKNEEELIPFVEGLEDRFGALPDETIQLIYIVRLRWLAIELGFEKIILKNGVMIAWFVTNNESAYYSSSRFASILSFLQQQQKKFQLKEQRERLYIIVERVKTIEQAYNILLQMRL